MSLFFWSLDFPLSTLEEEDELLDFDAKTLDEEEGEDAVSLASSAITTGSTSSSISLMLGCFAKDWTARRVKIQMEVLV